MKWEKVSKEVVVDKARVYVDFNELVENDVVLLSKDDWETDSIKGFKVNAMIMP